MAGYALQARLGEGGMGVVHLARRPDGRPVALKVIRPHVVGDDEARARLAREVGSLSRIRSPRVAEIVDADPWGAVPYVATRYVPGLSLHDQVRDEGPITGPDLDWFALCLAEALAAVHGCGVLHRDVKPSNVLMEGRSPVLIDFGLARVADDPRLTLTGWLLGTPGYLPPEILHGEDATPASDVHSWAATVAFAGTGHPPFGRGPTMAVMDRVRRGEHDLAGLPPRLHALVTQALDPDPARRPGLPEILRRLGATPTGSSPVLTQPLAVAARAGAEAATRQVSSPPATRPPTPPAWAAVSPPTLPAAPPPAWTPQATPPAWAPPAPPPVPLAERLRRLVLVGLVWLAAAAALAAYPYLTTAGLVLAGWLLRSGSLAGSAAGHRRRLRGQRWYDAPQVLLATPWHLLQSVPGTLALVVWSGFLALAGVLLGYAFALPTTQVLLLAGALFGAGLWRGPGGSRVRRPVNRVLHPLAARPVHWVVAGLLLAALASGAGALAQAGVDWAPAGAAPFAGLW